MKFFKTLVGLIFLFTLMITLYACSEAITLTADSFELTLDVGEEQSLNYTTNDEKGVGFTSSDSEIVSVTNAGVVTAIKPGNATITVTSKSDENISLDFNVTVGEAIIITGDDTVRLYETLTLDYTISEYLSNSDVYWYSSNEDIAIVSTDGVVTPVSMGSVTISAFSKIDSSLEASHNIDVIAPAATDIIIEGSLSEVGIGKIINLRATVNPTLASQDITWSSSDESVATVDETGKVTTISDGTVTIKAEAKDNADIFGTVEISVYNIPSEIAFSNASDYMLVDDSYQLTLDFLPIDTMKKEVKWKSSNYNVIYITQDGTITAMKKGTATITVESAYDSSVKTSIEITVENKPGIELSTTQNISALFTGDSFTISASPYPASEAGKEVTWSSSDKSIATVDENGLVTAVSPGMVEIIASISDDLTVSSSMTLTIYDDLDTNNLLDLLTLNHYQTGTIYQFTAFGSFNFVHTTYNSVSNYYYGEIPIIESLIEFNQKTRSGRLMQPLPDGITTYNEDNIHWIVVHDTGNTTPGSSALSHSNYLHQLSTDPYNDRWVSWHYTIDDEEIYQHLPDNERGYHAGDGSTLVGEGSTYLGGGNTNGIGIEMTVSQGSDIYRTWQRNAKLVASLLIEHNLPLENFKYHNDFSGKDCPNTLRNSGGLITEFEAMVAVEYEILKNHSDAEISMTSNNPEYLDNAGRIIKMPQTPMTVSYTVTVTENGMTESRTFYTYLPGISVESE